MVFPNLTFKHLRLKLSSTPERYQRASKFKEEEENRARSTGMPKSLLSITYDEYI